MSKSGFVSISAASGGRCRPGHRFSSPTASEIERAWQCGLPRGGSVIAGHVYDETGDTMPGVLVRVLRYQYLQGNRRPGTCQYRLLNRRSGRVPRLGLDARRYYYVDARSRINLNSKWKPGGLAAVGDVAAVRWRPGWERRRLAAALPASSARWPAAYVAALFLLPDDEKPEGVRADLFPRRDVDHRGAVITVGLRPGHSSTSTSDCSWCTSRRVSGLVTDADGNTDVEQQRLAC